MSKDAHCFLVSFLPQVQLKPTVQLSCILPALSPCMESHILKSVLRWPLLYTDQGRLRERHEERERKKLEEKE